MIAPLKSFFRDLKSDPKSAFIAELERKSMPWTTLNFGLHAGKTLPQVIFDDLGYFFWGFEKGVFQDERLRNEAMEIASKFERIRILNNEDASLVVEYFMAPRSRNFSHFHVVPRDQPEHQDGSRSDFIDLCASWHANPKDKGGYKLLIWHVKEHLFGNGNVKMSREKCEAFFDDDSNFA